MSVPYTPPGQAVVEPSSILLGAARCWRRARDTGRAPQPALHAELTPEGLGMLAPVLDGLFAAFEATYGRRFEIARETDARLSPDELAILDFLGDGSLARGVHSPVGGALDIARRSVIITTNLEARA